MFIVVNVHFHNAAEAKLDSALQLLEKLMNISQDIKDLTQKIDTATTGVATRIDRLSGQITNSMTDEEVNEIKSGLQAEVDRLTVMGQDPQNPIPTQ